MRDSLKIGKVEQYLRNKIDRDGAILLSLIDPDKLPFEEGAKVAEASVNGGADAILVGGSIGAQGIVLDKTTKLIREKVNVPIILFPGNVGTITPYADATYFMYVLNSREVYWMSTVQIQGAPVVKSMDIEPIPTGYIILEPGKAVGWVSNANLIPQNRGDLAAATALAGQYMGARMIVIDSGSGAEKPAPPKLIKTVRSQITVPFIYGGGCRSADHVKGIIKAGADGIQIGTAFELINGGKRQVEKKVRSIRKVIKEEGRAKKRRGGRLFEKTKRIIPTLKIPDLGKLRKAGFLKHRFKSGLRDTLQRKKHKKVPNKKGK